MNTELNSLIVLLNKISQSGEYSCTLSGTHLNPNSKSTHWCEGIRCSTCPFYISPDITYHVGINNIHETNKILSSE